MGPGRERSKRSAGGEPGEEVHGGAEHRLGQSSRRTEGPGSDAARQVSTGRTLYDFLITARHRSHNISGEFSGEVPGEAVTEVPLQDGARDVDDTESARVPAGVAHHRAKHRKRWFRRATQDAYVQIRQLLIWQLCALAGQVIAVALARQEHREIAEIISDISLAAMYGRALWALTSSHLHRATRNAAVVCLGLGPTLFWRATNPMLFTGFDEQLHANARGHSLLARTLPAQPPAGGQPQISWSGSRCAAGAPGGYPPPWPPRRWWSSCAGWCW